ncbi:hypothetical protein PO124_09720 [Bacillus licheniformis]|nr:hypothetical protein [Bacillus licheniformis]
MTEQLNELPLNMDAVNERLQEAEQLVTEVKQRRTNWLNWFC